jgi:hypothetical protein
MWRKAQFLENLKILWHLSTIIYRNAISIWKKSRLRDSKSHLQKDSRYCFERWTALGCWQNICPLFHNQESIGWTRSTIQASLCSSHCYSPSPWKYWFWGQIQKYFSWNTNWRGKIYCSCWSCMLSCIEGLQSISSLLFQVSCSERLWTIQKSF